MQYGDEVRRCLPRADDSAARKKTLWKQLFEGFDRIDGKLRWRYMYIYKCVGSEGWMQILPSLYKWMYQCSLQSKLKAHWEGIYILGGANIHIKANGSTYPNPTSK